MTLTAYCPSCREDALVRDGLCVWCESPTRTRLGKRVGVHGKLSDDQLRELYRVHDARGVSMRAIARAIWVKAGYASEGSCLEGMRAGWKRLHLAPLSQAEATARANRARRLSDSPGRENPREYRRWRAEREKARKEAA